MDRGDQKIIIKFDKNCHEKLSEDEYYFSKDELEMIEALQDKLITKYSEKGIIIEANPSSNSVIGDLSLKYHPIFRWYPPTNKILNEKYNRFGLRKGPICVCINTDDPGVFPTTIQNEFDCIRETAIKKFCECENGIDIMTIDKWIDDLRKAGVEIFDSNWLCQEL
jgi:hypothetical protein